MGDRTFGSIFIAGLIGLILPICECAIVPIAKKLMQKGTPPAVAITFMLAVPIVNSIVSLSTFVAFSSNFPIVLIRLFSGYILSILIGMIFLSPLKKNRDRFILSADNRHSGCCCSHHHQGAISLKEKLGHMAIHTWIEFSGAAGYLFIGAGIAAFFHCSVPMGLLDVFNRFPGGDKLFMMASALILNLCSEADAFVARSYSVHFSPSALMAFMVLGPMLDIKLLAMYRTIFKPRMIIILAITIFLSVFLWISLLDAAGIFRGVSQ